MRSLPPFESRKHLPSRLARLRELDGRAAIRVRGQGTEFDSLREYVRGDDVRSIDWRASARNRNVVVRTWQPERDRRVVLVLDTSRTSAGRVEDVPRLDSAMDAALLLAALAARAGDRIDFVAGDRRVRARLRSAGARDVAANLQDTMADLEPVIAEADWSALAGAVTQFGRQRALVVLLTPLEPSAVEEGLLPVLPALTRHHRVVLASVRDPALVSSRPPAAPSTRCTTPPRPSRPWSAAARPPSCSAQSGWTWWTPTRNGCPRRWPTTTCRSRPTGCSELAGAAARGQSDNGSGSRAPRGRCTTTRSPSHSVSSSSSSKPSPRPRRTSRVSSPIRVSRHHSPPNAGPNRARRTSSASMASTWSVVSPCQTVSIRLRSSTLPRAGRRG